MAVLSPHCRLHNINISSNSLSKQISCLSKHCKYSVIGDIKQYQISNTYEMNDIILK